MENENINQSKVNSSETVSEISRRNFFGKMGKAGIVAATGSVLAPLIEQKSLGVSAQSQTKQTPAMARALASRQARIDLAQANFLATPAKLQRQNNGDEELYSNKIGNFSKGLPHNSNGEVDVSAYNSLLTALNSGKSAMFEQIPLGGNRHLNNPQCGLAFDIEGMDACSLIQLPPPKFASREIAAEIAENYWMALLRDVPFTEYRNNEIAQAAAADLNLFGADFKGAKNLKGQVTPDLLFRGIAPSENLGPKMSQFWYLPCFFGANEVNQQIRTVRAIADGGRDYVTDFNTWLAIQNGFSPNASDIFDSTLRFVRSGRDLGQWVHVDVLYQRYLLAFLCISQLGVGVDAGNPYLNSATQDAFGTFGAPHIATLLCEVATRALKAVWNQKWFVHRRLRPEVFAERVDRTAYHQVNYPVHDEILNSVTSKTRLGGFLPDGNAFLPQAFPEGSPTHPSYGAGHATVAGACITILKAWFDEAEIIENPVVPDTIGQTLTPFTGETLTIGGELNKLASNVALGRNIAGVHWRSDGTESLKLGEAVAISVMRDHRACYNEQFNGFSLTKFDGTTIIV